MDFEVTWSTAAWNSVEEILSYLEIESPQAAHHLANEIVEVVRRMRSFPYLGAVHRRIRGRVIRETLCQKYRIFYDIDAIQNQIVIINVWHGSRREPTARDLR